MTRFAAAAALFVAPFLLAAAEKITTGPPKLVVETGASAASKLQLQ